MKALFPRNTANELQTVVINTAGGVTGGDRFQLNGRAGPDTGLAITTQTAERAYRAQPGETGHISTTLVACPGAHLQWLPQETILFNGCALERSITVDLAPDARLLFVEPIVFGRQAMGERLTQVKFRDRIDIRRAGVPLYRDAMILKGDVATQMALPQTANGACALATIVSIAPEAEAQLSPVRDSLPETAGASLIRPDLLVIRILAEDSHELRRSLVPTLTCLRGKPLPRPWTL